MVSKEMHFTRAAEKLGISQATLSHQIKMLEQEIGHALFNRISKRIELTKVGEIVRQEALTIQHSLQSISTQINAFANMEYGELKIAVLPGEITDLVSTLCVKFTQLYPNIKVVVQTTDQVETAVLENQADFGIGFTLEHNNMLQATKLYDDEFYLISNQGNEGEEALPFSNVLDKPLILFPPIHQCRKILEKTSRSFGRQLEPIVETSSVESILKLVRNGVGNSVVSRTLYEFYDTEDLYLQPIENPTLERTVYLVMKKNCFVDYATRKFIQLLVEEIEKLRFHTEKAAIASLQKSL